MVCLHSAGLWMAVGSYLAVEASHPGAQSWTLAAALYPVNFA